MGSGGHRLAPHGSPTSIKLAGVEPVRRELVSLVLIAKLAPDRDRRGDAGFYRLRQPANAGCAFRPSVLDQVPGVSKASQPVVIKRKFQARVLSSVLPVDRWN